MSRHPTGCGTVAVPLNPVARAASTPVIGAVTMQASMALPGSMR